MVADSESCAECLARNEIKAPILLGVVFWGSLIIAAVLLFLYFYKFHGSLSSKSEVFGQFGDYIGGILNPLFSLVALLALFYTIRLQSIEMQRSTAQLKQSALELTTQNALMARQGFETSFFNMLRSFSDVVSNARAQNDNLVGQKCFTEILEVFLKAVNSDGDVAASFKNASKVCGYDIDSYFRVFSDLIKFVDRSFEFHDAKFYMDIVRSRLSNSELNLICHKFVTVAVSKDIFALIGKYDLLRYMDSSSVD